MNGRQFARTAARTVTELAVLMGRTEAIQRCIEGLFQAGVTWDELLLVLSNVCVERYKDGGKGRRQWHRRALVLHKAFESERLARKVQLQGGIQS